MLHPLRTNRFKKSVERCVKRGYETQTLKEIMRLLVGELPLPERCRPHKLSGNFSDCRECHIKPDWLPIYRYDYAQQQIIFEDTGSHSDLF